MNYSLTLFKAQARGGWGVTFALSYNSQNWRRDTAGTARTWIHGRDGYGWKLLAGSMTPLYQNYSAPWPDDGGGRFRAVLRLHFFSCCCS